jgi:hypothetical protein
MSDLHITSVKRPQKIRMFKIQNKIGPTVSLTEHFGHLYLGYHGLPFDFAQGGESFDAAQDREPVERLVEPFRVSSFVFRDSPSPCGG